MPTFEEIRNKYGSFENYAAYASKNLSEFVKDIPEFNIGKDYKQQLEDFKKFEFENSEFDLAAKEMGEI